MGIVRFFAIAALAAAISYLLGCGQPAQLPMYRVVVDSKLDPSVLEAVRVATSEWELAVPETHFAVTSGFEDYVGRNVHDWPLDTIFVTVGTFETPRVLGRTLRGFDDSNSAFIVMRADHASDAKLLAHELGHAMNLRHSLGGVMEDAYPLTERRTVSCLDAENFCRVWHPGETCACGLTSRR